jgi:hypothetical protein
VDFVDIIVFDTETTGLSKKEEKNEVVQFSAIWLNDKFEIDRVVNRYCKTNQFMTEGALRVHKLTDKLVDTLSGGKYFEQTVDEEDLRGCDNVTWVSYGATFDMGICNQTLLQNGCSPINFGKSVRTLSFEREGIFNFCALDTIGRMSGVGNRRKKLISVIDQYIGIQRFTAVCEIFRKKYEILNPFFLSLMINFIIPFLEMIGGTFVESSRISSELFDLSIELMGIGESVVSLFESSQPNIGKEGLCFELSQELSEVAKEIELFQKELMRLSRTVVELDG